MAANKICCVCGKPYEYCNNCPRKQGDESSFLFDSKNCERIWDILNAYRTHSISADEANNRLRSCDLSKETTFKPVWKTLLAEIRSKVQPVAEPAVVEEAPEQEATASEENEYKRNNRFNRRRRNF